MRISSPHVLYRSGIRVLTGQGLPLPTIDVTHGGLARHQKEDQRVCSGVSTVE